MIDHVQQAMPQNSFSHKTFGDSVTDQSIHILFGQAVKIGPHVAFFCAPAFVQGVEGWQIYFGKFGVPLPELCLLRRTVLYGLRWDEVMLETVKPGVLGI